jgi:nucleoside-diphosphate-sugar epimerase
MNKLPKAFVTGSNGFVGQALVARLISEGYQVKALTRKKEANLNLNVEIVYGDLVSKEIKLDNFLSDCDLIFHCAGEVNNIGKMRQLHVDGTRKLLASALRSISKNGRPIHLVQLSSVGAYGPAKPANYKRKITEKTLENPSGEYETTKTEADKLVVSMAGNLMSYTILRPSSVVGPQMKNQSFKALLLTIKKNLFFFIGSRENIATYVHINDVVEVLILCANNDKAKNEIFNLSNDCLFSEIVLKVSALFGHSAKRLCISEPLIRFIIGCIPRFINFPLTNARVDSLVSRTQYSNKKLKEMLGFEPKHSIPDFAIQYIIDSIEQ